MMIKFLPTEKSTIFAFLGIIFVIGFGPLLIHTSFLNSFDQFIYQLNSTQHNFQFIQYMKKITYFGGSEAFFLAGFLFFILAALLFEVRMSGFILLGFLMVRAIVWVVKESTERLRPVSSVMLAEGFSFPSGHATNIVFLMVIVYWFLEKWLVKSYQKILITSFLFLMIMSVGLSRIVLEVHWASDVIAGCLLGISFGILMRAWGKRIYAS